MAVTITYGNPNKWRRWHITGQPSGPDSARPDPGTWFFEARYHHTGNWKVGLDFRPVDGKMPELWHPPFMWRPAHEIEEVQKKLALGTEGAADLMDLPHMYWFVKSVKDYGLKAKDAKKLLFGSAEGSGALAHAVKVDSFTDPLPVLDSPSDPSHMVAGHGKGLSSNAELVSKHKDNNPIGSFMGMPVIVNPMLDPGKVLIVSASDFDLMKKGKFKLDIKYP